MPGGLPNIGASLPGVEGDPCPQFAEEARQFAQGVITTAWHGTRGHVVGWDGFDSPEPLHGELLLGVSIV